MKRFGIEWKDVGRFRDSEYDKRYAAGPIGNNFWLIIYAYKGRHYRYEAECHRNGDSWYFIGEFRLFNEACKKAAEWATLKRLQGEI